VVVQLNGLVSKGDPLLMVEAMKMEFVIRAPFAGIVKVIRVQEGAQVSPGDCFLELEATQTP
jgi:biotin carboxyl carrier protein